MLPASRIIEVGQWRDATEDDATSGGAICGDLSAKAVELALRNGGVEVVHG